MRKIIYLFLIGVLFQLHSYSQVSAPIKNEKTTIGKIPQAEFCYFIDSGDTSYLILYRNAEYETIVDVEDIRFVGGQEEVDALYNAIATAFEPANKKSKEFSIMLKVGDENVFISNSNVWGYQVVIRDPDGYFMLNEKQLKKLFGKS